MSEHKNHKEHMDVEALHRAGGSPRLLAAASWTGTLEARAAELLEAGETAVLVTILSSEGSAPRHAGTRALQTARGFEGTVGGGQLEALAMSAARRCLAEGRSLRAAFNLAVNSADTDMVCGGRMEVLCEVLRPEDEGLADMFRVADAALRRGLRGVWTVDLTDAETPPDAASGEEREQPIHPTRRLHLEAPPDGAPSSSRVSPGLDEAAALLDKCRGRPGLTTEADRTRYVEPLDAPPVLLLCGGGHVALETARLAHDCDFVVDVVDDRAEFANAARFPMARRCLTLPRFEGLLESCDIGARHFVAIMTRGHAFDREALEQALRSPARYIGMIGSRAKRDHVYGLLRAGGVSSETLDAVCCPIGLGILAETPRQIAVSVVAELLAARAGTLARLRAVR